MDTLVKEERSRLMSRIGAKNTKPEILLRKYLHAKGVRFRLHRTDLPGRPDVVLPKYRAAIFVHGCFWHQHPGCKKARVPKSNVDFWEAKFARNAERDARKIRDLEALGWRVFVIWECEIESADSGVLDAVLDRILSYCPSAGM